MTSANGARRTSPFGDADSASTRSAVVMSTAPPPPMIMKITSAGTAAIMAYWKRLRTTPGISVSCVVADTTVVSETGARLSPKAAPDRIAAKSHTGSAPITSPAGYMSVQKATVVP